MTTQADLVLTNGTVHTHASRNETTEAVAVRGGRVVRTGPAYDIEFLAGAGTRVVDLEGRVVLPGFIDAHTHLPIQGQYLVHADLRDAAGPEECVDRLRDTKPNDAGWVIGFGFDESNWSDARYLARNDLDQVTTDHPVVAFREDMHLAAVNTPVLDEYAIDLPAAGVETEDGRPTGVLVEAAVDVIRDETEPTPAELPELITAASAHAHARGITGVHDMVRRPAVARAYRDLALAGTLDLRVRLNHYDPHFDAIVGAGLAPNHGSMFVTTGAIKAFADGSFGSRTARVSSPYEDANDRGEWVTEPEDLENLARRVSREGFQLAIHAIGDAAIDASLDALTTTPNPATHRHRIEHAELATDDAIHRFADHGIIASVQPNFLKWAHPGGLYDTRIGDRRTLTNRYRSLLDAGVRVAFGSDGMPLDPLYGIHQTVNVPDPAQQLTVTEALTAYTQGSAYAGFTEDTHGTIEPGNHADLIVLADSPWDNPDRIRDIDVSMTIVAGNIVHNATQPP